MLRTDRLQDFNDGSSSSTSDHESRQTIVCNTSVAGNLSQSKMPDVSKIYYTHDSSEKGFGLQASIGRDITDNL